MDDLKLYGKKKEELKSLAETMRIFTEDVRRMRFGLQKCATLAMKRQGGRCGDDDRPWKM